MIRIVCYGLVAALIAAASTVSAQTPRAPSLEGAPDLSPVEIQRLFDAYALVQAQEMLKLTDAQYAQFVTRLKALQEVRRRTQRQRQQLMQELLRLSNQQEPPAEDTTIRERLKALEDLDDRAAGDLQKAYAGIDQVLDLRQQARFRVFEEQMERRKIELLLRARAANRLKQPRRIPPL